MELFHDLPWLLAPIIFFARICDVSLDTVRLILVVRSYRGLATAIGFLEILIWVTAAGLVFRNLGHWYLAIAYAAGFATGNFVGIWLEQRLAMGLELVRTVSENLDINLANRLRAHGYSVIELAGKGDGNVQVEVLLIVERRRKVPALLKAIHEEDPAAFWTITDVKRQQPILPALAPDLAATAIKLK